MKVGDDDGYLVMKVIQSWKLSRDKGYLVMIVIIVKEVMFLRIWWQIPHWSRNGWFGRPRPSPHRLLTEPDLCIIKIIIVNRTIMRLMILSRDERYYRSGIVSRILALFGKYRISRYQGNLARFYTIFLASPDALEVMWVSDWVSVSTDLNDVTLVSDVSYWRLDWCYSCNWGYWWRWWRRLDWCDPGEWWYLLKTWLMLL